MHGLVKSDFYTRCLYTYFDLIPKGPVTCKCQNFLQVPIWHFTHTIRTIHILSSICFPLDPLGEELFDSNGHFLGVRIHHPMAGWKGFIRAVVSGLYFVNEARPVEHCYFLRPVLSRREERRRRKEDLEGERREGRRGVRFW